MKNLFAFIMLMCIYSTTYAQNLTVKSVSLRLQDARAASQSRLDKHGKKCAIIRVGVVGVDDLVFPDAVGNVEHLLSEYVVYVPSGLKTFRYDNKSGKHLGTITFNDYGIEIDSQASYDVIFESDNHLRSAIFSIQPKHAQLFFDGTSVGLDAEGIAIINKPVGKYSYKVMAYGFESQSGIVSLIEDDISTVTDVALQEVLYPVTVNVFPKDATVFIDNIPYTKEDISDLQLAGGEHMVRVTATGYEDNERTINVSENASSFSFILKENKQEIVRHKEERTRTSVNIRNAHYITFGGEGIISNTTDNMFLWGIKVDYDFVAHFGGIFAVRVGAGMSFLFPAYTDDFEGKEILQDTINHISFDIPIQVGISIPFGRFNKNLFSVFAGGYGRGLFMMTGMDDAEQYREVLPDDHFELKKSFFDYGVRASLKLDINKFTIGADLSRSFNGCGLSGAITLGVKLYTFN